MDPLSALELTQVVFDNTVRLFKFLSALVDFPKECEKYRLQLIIEYNRVLAWAKAVGLIDSVQVVSSSPSSSSSNSDGGKKKKEEEEKQKKNIAALASTLNTNATELILILSRIQWLLAEFRELNERYGNELIPDEVVGVGVGVGGKKSLSKGEEGEHEEKRKKEDKDKDKGEEDKKEKVTVWKPLERERKRNELKGTDSDVHEAKQEKGASSSSSSSSSDNKTTPKAKPPQPLNKETSSSLLQISSLALSYDQSTKLSLSLSVSAEKKKETTHSRGTNHIRRFLQHTKDVITHPVRVRWVMVDQEAFEALLLDLHSLTERLHELMRNHDQAKMDDMVARTYREMILARNGIGELQDMVLALGRMVEGIAADDDDDDEGDIDDIDGYQDYRGETRATRTRKGKVKVVNEVRDLVRLKRMAKVSEQMLRTLHDPARSISGGLEQAEFSTEITVTQYGDAMKDGQVDFLEAFELAPEPGGVDDPSLISRISRPRGYLSVERADGSGLSDDAASVWIEWKAMGDYPAGSVKERESYLRTLTLAQMLRLPKPTSLHVPECIGFLDDRDVFGTERYGLVFRHPEEPGWEYVDFVSLYDLLGIDALKPSISQRVDLALKLCSTVLNLHAVNWLHKGVLSVNVMLVSWRGSGEPNDEQVRGFENGRRFWDNAGEPLLTGFEYSRPENSVTTARSLDTAWDLYRWPSIQREHPTDQNSRKTYDLYSLGLMLLEIGHWQPLDEILCLRVRDDKEKMQEQRDTKQRGYVKTREKPSSVPLHQSKMVRAWLLETETHTGQEENAPFIRADKPNPVRELGNTMGDRYCRAVKRCLWAHGKEGFGVEDVPDQSTDSEVGIRLQEAFTRYVIEELQAVRV
ncbi:prion-inhibition and propagation-domain-containing protein [Copromyces sp. CBS 386.78]|nr:prion-inhibition and propagation-domain-containing protein [Copromyces sp. CBS 386.78]